MFDCDREKPPNHPENNKQQQNPPAHGYEPIAEKSSRPAGLLTGSVNFKVYLSSDQCLECFSVEHLKNVLYD